MNNWSRRLFAVIIAVAIIAVVAALAHGQSVNAERVVAELEPEIQRTLLAGNIPSASIALVENDRVIWTGAYGYSNLFRHLLTHTSGLPADFGPFPVWGDTVPPSLDDYLRQSLKVSRAPLVKVEYSNTAFTLVGYLVQKLSGVSYKQYIQDNIFTPLEMTSTAFEPRPDMEERLAIPYVVDEKTHSQVGTVRLKASVWPAGLVYGTVLNQANWLICNLNGGVFKGKRLISEDTLNQMFTRQYDQFKGGIEGIWGNETAGFGLTWWSEVRDGDRYFAHSGSVPGYTAFLLGNRDRKLGFAILTNGNRAHPHLFKLADKAMDLMKKHSMKS